MRLPLAVLLPTTSLLHLASAQTGPRYTVWASVIFSRTGERTPEILGSLPVTLTSVGAQQQYANGDFFRKRYFESYTNFTNTNGVSNAPLVGMSPEIPDVQRLYVQALDEQSAVASAQAFLQGLYPPVSFAGNSSELQDMVDPTSMLANSSYVTPPLNGYRYAQIHSSGLYDPEFVYVGGSLECPAFVLAVEDWISTAGFAVTEVETAPLYEKIGPAFLSGVLTSDKWGFMNAYAIYDYLSYQNEHNSTAQQLFASSDYTDAVTGVSDLDLLRDYSNQQLYGWFGNLYAHNDIANEGFLGGVKGSISTIAGNMLAAKVLGQLQTAIEWSGEFYQLSLLFGDFEPLLSFFALADLPALNSNFFGQPNFGSIASFELFSYADPSNITFPAPEDLWVQFYFQNGTDADSTYQSYPLFNNGPDMTQMQWVDFEASMTQILIGSVGEWCQQCGAGYVSSDRIFCAYWNTTDSLYGGDSSSGSYSSYAGLSPVIGGIIGAIVALAIAGLLFGILMLFAGVRLHRVKSRKSELGGFKGSQKLASDRDLTLPKGGATVGATIETPASPVAGGHERVGSWELKHNDIPNIAASQPAQRRPSFEDDDDIADIGSSPFREGVKPDERV